MNGSGQDEKTENSLERSDHRFISLRRSSHTVQLDPEDRSNELNRALRFQDLQAINKIIGDFNPNSAPLRRPVRALIGATPPQAFGANHGAIGAHDGESSPDQSRLTGFNAAIDRANGLRSQRAGIDQQAANTKHE
ncbi:MAG: hypothetical protein CMN91_07625 [Synechococcus sp. ARS1019]|nr:hypothetical protein [Synechococcus sp. ARS1019]